jgi:hypothetical protein
MALGAQAASKHVVFCANNPPTAAAAGPVLLGLSLPEQLSEPGWAA